MFAKQVMKDAEDGDAHAAAPAPADTVAGAADACADAPGEKQGGGAVHAKADSTGERSR